MTGEAGFKAAKVLGPKADKIAVVAITAASAGTDMSAAAQLGNEVTGKFVALYSDVEVHYMWGPAGRTVDETQVAGANRCFTLAAKTLKYEYATATHLYLKGAAAATGLIRVAIASD